MSMNSKSESSVGETVRDGIVTKIESLIDERIEERYLDGRIAEDFRKTLEYVCLELKNIHVLDMILYPSPYCDDELELAVANLKRVEAGKSATDVFQDGDWDEEEYCR